MKTHWIFTVSNYGIEIWMYVKENIYDIDNIIKEINIKRNTVIKHLDNVCLFLQKSEFYKDAPFLNKILGRNIEIIL